MRLSSYVDGDGATVRATEREEEVFAGDPLGPPFSPLYLSPCIPPPPSHRQTVQCAFLRTAQSGRRAGYASSAYRGVARNRSLLFFLAAILFLFSHLSSRSFSFFF